MQKTKILLAEDEPFLGKIIKESLEARDFEVMWCHDGLKAYSAFRTFHPDICILDVMMPQKDGFTLARDIRLTNAILPILFLTAKSLTEDVLRGFASGGNDYLKKPFSMEELIVRLQSLLGRQPHPVYDPEGQDFVIGLYSLNAPGQLLSVGTQQIKLSHREAALLQLLIENKNRVLDRKIALDLLWGSDNLFNARSMDVFISKLRKHLKQDTDLKILNIRGVGYKLVIR